jgi:hypothetical protein
MYSVHWSIHMHIYDPVVQTQEIELFTVDSKVTVCICLYVYVCPYMRLLSFMADLYIRICLCLSVSVCLSVCLSVCTSQSLLCTLTSSTLLYFIVCLQPLPASSNQPARRPSEPHGRQRGLHERVRGTGQRAEGRLSDGRWRQTE